MKDRRPPRPPVEVRTSPRRRKTASGFWQDGRVVVVVAVWNCREEIEGSDIVTVDRIGWRTIGQIEVDPEQRLRLCVGLEVVDDKINPMVLRQGRKPGGQRRRGRRCRG